MGKIWDLFILDRIRIVGNKEFLAANPAAKRWFERVQIPVEDVNAQQIGFYEGEDKSEDIRRHAEEWIDRDRELFDRWLEEARREGKL